jgi:hypothetical protein
MLFRSTARALVGAALAWSLLSLSASHAQPAAKPTAPSIAWETLALAKASTKGTPGTIDFPAALKPFDGKVVSVTGFMVPLEAKAEQTRFLLTAQPQDCEYCIEGGPSTFIEVRSVPLRYSSKPLTMVGRLQLLRADASGMYYRLTEGEVHPRR